MKTLNCKNWRFQGAKIIGRFIFLAESAPEGKKTEIPPVQKDFKEVTDAVHALEQAKLDATSEYKKAVYVLQIMLGTKPELFSPELLTALSNRKESKIRWLVAMNNNTPRDVLVKFASDKKDPEIRRTVALLKDLPEYLLIALSKDEDEIVRGHVARNSSTPKPILNMLAKDKDEYVRIYAKDNLNGRKN